MDTSHRLRFRQRKQISSQTTCLTTAQPLQNTGVATPESLDASGSPQSQQQPHTLAPDLPDCPRPLRDSKLASNCPLPKSSLFL